MRTRKKRIALVVDRVNEDREDARRSRRRGWRWHGSSAKPYITAPIVGATKPHHLADAAAALDVRLSPEEIATLEEPYVPHPVLGF